MMKRSFGLIGKSLTHSFSPAYFKEKFHKAGILDCEYGLYDIDDINEVTKLLNTNYHGFNVTIPYKETIIPYLDQLDDEAKKIGAVNTLKNINGKWIGYNTDVIGFERDLFDFLDGEVIQNALILGSGGASKGIQYVLNKNGISFLVVSRTQGDISYNALSARSISKHRLIINTSPIGMFPKVDQMPDLELSEINSDHYLYDLIYNPQKTLFLKRSEARGAKVRSGLGMLRYQAEESWIIWNKK